jgi:hypothetical protein
MKKLELAQSVQILPNLGVIAGIIFLALEISQDTAIMAAQCRVDLADRRTRVAEILITTPILIELGIRASDGQQLTR